MNSPLSRIAWMMFLCFCLYGCAATIISTNLNNAPAQPEETQLLKSLGFVIHPSIGKGVIDSGKDRTSWVHALADFTDMGNIFFFEDGKPTGMIHSYAEFSKTHPIVTIELRTKDFSENELNSIFPILSIASLGIIPAYYSEPYTATFTLSIPDEKHVPAVHWDYTYHRQQYFSALLLPFANYLITQAGAGSNDTSWKDEEKRRLLLRFLEDAKQPLREYLTRVRRAP